MRDYRRGLARIYLVLSVGWIIWALYKPVLDHKRFVKFALERYNTLNTQCREEDDRQMQAYERKADIWVQRGGLQPHPRDMKDCFREVEMWQNEFYAALRQTTADIYWAGGYRKVATFCLVPPVVGCIAILAGVLLFRWIREGFHSRA